jgi:hypothetical protein
MTIHQAKAVRLSPVRKPFGEPTHPKHICAELAVEHEGGNLPEPPRETPTARFEPPPVPEVERRRAYVIRVGCAVRNRTYAVSGTDIAAKIISAHKK